MVVRAVPMGNSSSTELAPESNFSDVLSQLSDRV